MKISCVCALTVCFILVSCVKSISSEKFPQGFVDIKEVIPSIIVEARYFGEHNFVGTKVDGYNAPKCIFTKEAAMALSKVQEELIQKSLTLKVYDCYRPKRAVDHFVSWAQDINNIKMKKEFYPDIEKSDTIEQGYISPTSGHSRGSSIDLTIVPIPIPPQEEYIPGMPLKECYLSVNERFKDNSLDMGTGFDCFNELSHTENAKVGKVQLQNRLLLKSVMGKYGFTNYVKEWWHYRLKNEPFPDTYFDFVIN